MAKQEEIVRWQFLLDEDRWDSRTVEEYPLDQSNAPDANPASRARAIRFWTLAIAAILLAGSVSVFWLWREAQAGLEEVRDQLTAAIELEIWADERGDRAMAAGLLDANASPTWRNQNISRFFPLPDGDERQISAHIADFDLQDDRALVTVLVTDSRLAVPYQETRVYRKTKTGWIRTAPSADFWGVWESQESTYFAFRYRTRDRDAVTAAVPEIDRLYERIARSLGLPLDPGREKIAVEIRISGTVAQSSTRNSNGRVLAVASPHLLPRPLGLSTEAALAQSVLYQIINLTIWERMDNVPGDWQSIRSGLRLWLIWAADGVLAQSRGDVVRWLYEESMAPWEKGYSGRPQNYAAICQGFWLWQMHPYEVGIPLTCDQTEGQLFTPVRMPVELRQLPMPEMDPEFRGAWTRLNTGRAIALATLFDFVANTYGPASVPELLAQTPDYLRWHSLVSSALDVSAAEFEAEWQAHMRLLAGIEP